MGIIRIARSEAKGPVIAIKPRIPLLVGTPAAQITVKTSKTCKVHTSTRSEMSVEIAETLSL